MKKVRGDNDFDYELLHTFVDSALWRAGVPLEGLLIDLRWTGVVNGSPAALFTVQEPGHGVVAFAFHGTTESFSADLEMLMPAAGVEDRPIAWRMRGEEHGDIETDRVTVIAPEKAASVSLEITGQAPVDVVLDETGKGEATVEPTRRPRWWRIARTGRS